MNLESIFLYFTSATLQGTAALAAVSAAIYVFYSQGLREDKRACKYRELKELWRISREKMFLGVSEDIEVQISSIGITLLEIDEFKRRIRDSFSNQKSPDVVNGVLNKANKIRAFFNVLDKSHIANRKVVFAVLKHQVIFIFLSALILLLGKFLGACLSYFVLVALFFYLCFILYRTYQACKNMLASRDKIEENSKI
ncbi:MAG: hypothetical protein HYY61_02345 [Deltaproteobacteria bacterium]|nr:hypothetical protein [Deltaproteobacteria bacterium]